MVGKAPIKPLIGTRVAVWIHGQTINHQGESGEVVKVLDRERVVVKLRNGVAYQVSRAHARANRPRPPMSWDYLV